MTVTSLRSRLLLLVGIPLVLLLLIETVISYFVGVYTADHVFDSWLLDSAHSIAHEVREERGELRFIAAEDAIEMFEWDELDETYFHISDSQGRKIAGDLGTPLPIDFARLRDGPLYFDVPIGERAGRLVMIMRKIGEHGEVVVQVAETLNKRREMTTVVLSLVAAKKTALLLAAMIAIGIAIRRGLAPLRRLADHIATRSPRELTPVSAADAPDEMRILIDNTNNLLERIDHMLGAHEKFIGNIAHQIRTPLAGLKLQTQLALEEPCSDNVRASLDAIAAAADHMTHVNSQLLKLARAELAFDRGTRAAEADLVALSRACLYDLAPTAREHEVEVIVESEAEHLDIEGDPALIQEMLRNLVENAILYGRPHGHVWVTLESTSMGARIIVEDDGPGIPIEEREQIFERFYRRPSSPGDGSGLGLPIVREIARAHGADVRLDSRAADSGTRFVIDLPRAAQIEHEDHRRAA